MRTPKHWYNNSLLSRLTSALLSPLGEFYGNATIARMNMPCRWRAPVPVICVGNATAGGSGKTPMSRLLRRLLSDVYDRPAVLLRGYGSKSTKALLVHYGATPLELSGDEAVLHARDGLTIVSPNRVDGAKLAIIEQADAIIMDDGMQNRDLVHDVRILVVPSDTRFGNERCIPAGPLRCPLEHTLEHTDIVVAVGDQHGRDWMSHLAQRYGLPVFWTHTRMSGFTSEMLTNKVVAYAGIAFTERFFEGLREAGLNVVRTFSLADHEEPSDNLCHSILKTAKKHKAVLITTEKDAARLRDRHGNAAALHAQSKVLAYHLQLEEQYQFMEVLEKKIAFARNERMPPEHRRMLPDDPSTSTADRLVE